MSDNFSLFDLFREEARSHAATLSQGLLELESDAGNPQRIEPLMRAAHSIKGASRIVNIEAGVEMAHAMEDALVAAQRGLILIGRDDIDVFLRGADVLASLAEIGEADVANWSASQAGNIAELKAIFLAMVAGNRKSQSPPPAAAPSETAADEAVPPLGPANFGEDGAMLSLFQDEVRQQIAALRQGMASLELAGPGPEDLNSLVQAAQSLKGVSRLVAVAGAVRLAEALEGMFSRAMQGGSAPGPEQRTQLARCLGLLAELEVADEEGVAEWSTTHRTEITGLARALQRQMAEGGSLVPLAAPEAPRTIPVETRARAEVVASPVAPPPVAAEPVEAVVRVTAQSLNRLMSLAGESLVQARWSQPFATAMLKLKKHQDHVAGLLDQLAQSLSGGVSSDQVDTLVAEARQQNARCRQVLGERISEFEDHAAQAENLNTRLYREVIVSRMRPFSDGAHGFPRLVRDMGRKLDKEVRLEIIGPTTEVDRDILEKLEAPLTHLLRNAVDHGIEAREDRLAAGKSECGLVRVEVRHRAGALLITIADDGGGIDLDRLRRKVVEKGLASTDMAQSLSEQELLEFLFLPGFSTAAALTEYSGRGVGLDVVQDTVRKVGGSVHITTKLGRGTQFHLHLPITLSVVRAVLVEIGGEPYAFAHNRIDRLIRVPRASISSLESRQFVTVDGQNVGLVLASQLFDLTLTQPVGDDLPVVLLSDLHGLYGLIVEAFRGEQDLVVRPLDARLGKVPNISAAAILDDGTPVLIADVEDLVRSMDHLIQGGALQRFEKPRSQARPSKRILVVDDSITVREVERQLLSTHGYEVAVAVDGMEGWNIARAQPFDLIVTDVDMPRMNGLELVRLIRNHPGLKDIPVVIVSYKDREEDRLSGLEVGANYYLTKSSFHDNTFLQAVSDLVGEP